MRSSSSHQRRTAGRTIPPWWLLLAAGAFLGYFALLVWSDLGRPESIGFEYTFDESGLTVSSVAPNSPAARAGLQPRDRVLEANGLPIARRVDWQIVGGNIQSGQTLALEVARGSERLGIGLVVRPAPARFWLTPAGATLATARAVQCVTLLVALVVAFARPAVTVVRVGAWLLATISVYSFAWPYGLAAHWRALPDWAGLPLWLPFASSLAAAPILLTFFASFPFSFVRSPALWAIMWSPAAVTVFAQLRPAVAAVYWPHSSPSSQDVTIAATAVATSYAIGAGAMLVAGYRRVTDPTTKRRVRMLTVGSLVGILGVVPGVIAYNQPAAVLGSTVFASPLIAVATILGLALPSSFAYAVLRHRLFDVSFILRRSLQYALARGVLASTVPVAASAFLADLYLNRDIAFEGMLRTRGWVYAGLAGLALVARARRQHWLEQLDRRFFRERYDAQILLRSIAEDVRRAPDLGATARQIVTTIEAALHPERVVLLTRTPPSPRFEVAASAPPSLAQEALDGASAIVALLRPLCRPVQASSSGGMWLLGQLPREDQDWLDRHGAEMLVPVRFGTSATEALFVLGPRRSEEPYSEEDEHLLMTIGYGVALLLERDAAGMSANDALEECPACGRCFDAGTRRCADDGSTLAHVRLPRVLEKRFSLERRIGRGGMGAVYLATDRALSRPVAIKVLREDLVDASAASRFQLEARFAASLTHPNAVSVYDIGVTSDGRAFLVMELLEGRTLRDELNRVGRLSSDRTLQILRGVSAAIDEAHARQLIHRDLKPENIFLRQDEHGETAKVLDFGLAKALSATSGTLLTQPGSVAGTPEYMAPEHLGGGDASPDWDLWALAVMACEMIAGRRPFDRRPVGAPQLDRLPPACRPVFARALSVDPLDRPTSGRELIDQIERALATDAPSS